MLRQFHDARVRRLGGFAASPVRGAPHESAVIDPPRKRCGLLIEAGRNTARILGAGWKTTAETKGGSLVTRARYRTIWLSDTHLGTRDCQAQMLLGFLEQHDCEYLYLVGDIIDFWRLRRSPQWAQLHSDVVHRILSKARAGTIVTLVPGNHDEYLRRFCDLQLGNVMVTREAVHRTATGRLFLILHGDEFDGVTRCHRWL